MVSEIEEQIEDYLKSCRELSQMTEYNGWIDNSTLHFQIVGVEPDGATVEIRFEEVFISACCEERAERWGRAQLGIDNEGFVVSFTLL